MIHTWFNANLYWIGSHAFETEIIEVFLQQLVYISYKKQNTIVLGRILYSLHIVHNSFSFVKCPPIYTIRQAAP